MRKMTLIIMFSLCFLLVQPAVYADEMVEQNAPSTDADERVILTIDEVVERGIEQNSMRLLLQYQFEIMDNQEKETIENIDDVNEDLDEAEETKEELEAIDLSSIDERIDRLGEEVAALTEEIAALQAELIGGSNSEAAEAIGMLETQNQFLQKQINLLFKSGELEKLARTKAEVEQGLKAIEAQIEALEDAVDQLQLALKKIKIGELQLTYEEEEVELIVEMMLKSTYIGLLSSLEQIDFMQAAYEQAESDVDLLKLKYELGLVSAYEVEQGGRELVQQHQDLEQVKQEYYRELAKLTLDIGVEYTQNIELQREEVPAIGDNLLRGEGEVAELVENSYSYKKAEQNLALAQMDYDDLESQEDVSQYKEKQTELAIDVEQEKLRQLKVDLKESIETTYYEFANSAQNVENRKRDLDYAKQDYEQLEKQYELGLLSKSQFEQSEMLVRQAEFDLKMAELKHYMMNEQVIAIDHGLIQTQ